jgi:RHS repeat-associated protein
LDETQAYTQVLEEYSNTGTVQVSYIYGNGLINQSNDIQTIFYLADGLGSTRLLTDAQGNILNSYNYNSFGKTINETGNISNKYLFTGEQFDKNLKEYYLRSRYYNTNNGRFSKSDTYEGSLDQPLSLHKFIYANANPINLLDPSGFSSFLTLQQLKELGNEIHDTVGRDFISGNSNRRADLKYKGGGLTILRILKEADNLPKGHRPYNGLRPDLADYGTHEVYEIKSRSKFSTGALELLIYELVLNTAPGQKNEWNPGATYTYTRNPIVLPYGKIAIVYSPIAGVITYNLLDSPNSSTNSSAIANAAALVIGAIIAAVVAAVARGSRSPGGLLA